MQISLHFCLCVLLSLFLNVRCTCAGDLSVSKVQLLPEGTGTRIQLIGSTEDKEPSVTLTFPGSAVPAPQVEAVNGSATWKDESVAPPPGGKAETKWKLTLHQLDATKPPEVWYVVPSGGWRLDFAIVVPPLAFPTAGTLPRTQEVSASRALKLSNNSGADWNKGTAIVLSQTAPAASAPVLPVLIDVKNLPEKLGNGEITYLNSQIPQKEMKISFRVVLNGADGKKAGMESPSIELKFDKDSVALIPDYKAATFQVYEGSYDNLMDKVSPKATAAVPAGQSREKLKVELNVKNLLTSITQPGHVNWEERKEFTFTSCFQFPVTLKGLTDPQGVNGDALEIPASKSSTESRSVSASASSSKSLNILFDSLDLQNWKEAKKKLKSWQDQFAAIKKDLIHSKANDRLKLAFNMVHSQLNLLTCALEHLATQRELLQNQATKSQNSIETLEGIADTPTALMNQANSTALSDSRELRKLDDQIAAEHKKFTDVINQYSSTTTNVVPILVPAN